ncbi:MAG: GntR family transcriptional regulator [Acetobacteraceae bacterium]
MAQKITALVQAEYEAGQRLPSEREMAKQFGVSRPTIREAILSLVMAGVLEVRHNSGVYVVGLAGLPDVQVLEGFGPFENIAARRLVEPQLAAAAARHPADGMLADSCRQPRQHAARLCGRRGGPKPRTTAST